MATSTTPAIILNTSIIDVEQAAEAICCGQTHPLFLDCHFNHILNNNNNLTNSHNINRHPLILKENLSLVECCEIL